MPNLVRIGPTVWISIPDTHTHTHTDSTLYIRLEDIKLASVTLASSLAHKR
jgi:hypothetical protein